MGVVVAGDRRGRELGFPTANVLAADQRTLPDDGVYAGLVERDDGSVHLAAVSVGRRPTYYRSGERLVEAYLLDFDGDLYGEHLRVTILDEIRPQSRFSSSAALVEQIRADVTEVRAVLAGRKPAAHSREPG